MLMAWTTRVISKMARTSSWRPHNRTSPPAARACFMAAIRVPMPELSIYATAFKSMRRRDWPRSKMLDSARRTSCTVAMSRSPRGDRTATPLDCVTSMSIIGSQSGSGVRNRSRSGRAPGGGGRPTSREVFHHGPPGAALTRHVNGETVRDGPDEEDSVAPLRHGLEVGRLVAVGVEGLAEILDLDDHRVVRRSHGHRDGLAPSAVVRVLDGVGQRLAPPHE